MPDRRPPVDDECRQTTACGRAEHDDCPHRHGFGGGLNLRRFRVEFGLGLGLCGCPCHASCPLTASDPVSLEAWYTSCTCPGADVERWRLDDTGVEIRDFPDLREKAERRSRAGREAVDATRARAARLSREEIREVYVSELRARDLKVPAEPVLDVVAAQIAGHPLPAIRILGENLFRAGKGLYDIRRRGRHEQR